MSESRNRARRRYGRRKGRVLAHLLATALLGAGLLSFGVVSGFAADRTIEVTGGIGSYAWNPSSAEVNPNGTVEFKNMNGTHAVFWESGPETPACPGVPGVGQANWS